MFEGGYDLMAVRAKPAKIPIVQKDDLAARARGFSRVLLVLGARRVSGNAREACN